MQEPNPDNELPQFARMEAARVIVTQAVSGAAANYRLTLPEVAYVVEGVLSDLRGNALAFSAAQFERATTPEPEAPQPRVVDNPNGAGRAEVRPASEPEAKAS